MNWKFFLAGLTIGLLLIVVTTCKSDKSSPTEPDPNDPPGSTIIQQIEEDIKSIEEAFSSGNTDEVKKQLTSGALAKYGSDLENQADKYSSFATALKNKKLIAYSNLYAEYEIEIDGVKYSVAFSKVSEGAKWQLVKL